jgi:hypothetical protein
MLWVSRVCLGLIPLRVLWVEMLLVALLMLMVLLQLVVLLEDRSMHLVLLLLRIKLSRLVRDHMVLERHGHLSTILRILPMMLLLLLLRVMWLL